MSTTSRITSGEEWKYLNGLAGFRGRGLPLPYPSSADLTSQCRPFDSARRLVMTLS